jgi:hypothetical protein
MLEFIGLFVVIYLVVTWLLRLITGKRVKREIYIIREYQIVEDVDEQPETDGSDATRQDERLPKNVVKFRR